MNNTTDSKIEVDTLNEILEVRPATDYITVVDLDAIEPAIIKNEPAKPSSGAKANISNDKSCKSKLKTCFLPLTNQFNYNDWNYIDLKLSIDAKICACKCITIFVIIAFFISALPLFKVKVPLEIKVMIIYFSVWSLFWMIFVGLQLVNMMKRAKQLLIELKEQKN